MAFRVPADLYYTKDHEWALVDENIVTVGVTEFALDALGDITFVDIKDAGDKVTQHEPYGFIESVKAVSDLFSPVGGTVVEVNTAVLDNPSLLNDDPWNEGWILRIEMEAEKELANLIKAPEYKKLIEA